MDFAVEWKSLWSISSVFSPPLLLSDKNSKTPIGPLIFTPKPNTPTSQLLHSSSLSPGLPPPYPHLSLPRLLQTHDSIPSTAASISSLLGSQLLDYSTHFHGFNSLQLLRIPHKNLVIAFFPTGENSDQVGFTLISVTDGMLSVNSEGDNFFQLAKEGCENRNRITRLMVNPVDDDDEDDGFGDMSNANRRNNVVGFLMVCTNFSVYWYRVGIDTVNTCSEFSVCLDYVGCGNAKMFKGNAVVSVSWSPYLREECLVLLENGDLLLFDVNYSSGKRSKLMSLVSAKNRIINKKMHASLNSKVRLEKEENGEEGWFGCEFSWHPRIFIASHSNGVFLVDMRSVGECNICCLLKLEMLSVMKNDAFVVLSRAGTDGFCFTVATRCLLLLCDVRKPLMPVLQWAHGLQSPRYMTVFRLSELRANSDDSKHKLASESGFCILLGSFWDSEFSLFCYGPNIDGNRSVYSEIAAFCNSYYAWRLPSELSLSGCDCNCGSCLVREEFSKSSLPDWIDWRQKKQLVLGFGILEADLSAQLSTPDTFGGFTLIRLMSSGKLEAQQYHAAWESEKISEVVHKRIHMDSENDLLYVRDDSEYDGEKKFQHLKFDFLNAFLKDKLAEYIAKIREKWKESSENDLKKYPVNSKSNLPHEICDRLKAVGLSRVSFSLAVSDVLKDINLPTSIYEIYLRSIWATLPIKMVHFAFSSYSNFPKDPKKHQEPLEFLDIPDQLQVPPFALRKPSYRSNKWSSKVQPSDGLVGPLLPPQFLTTLHNLLTEEQKKERELYLEKTGLSVDSLFKLKCDKVLKVVEDHVKDSDAKTQDEDFVSLADDTDEISYGIKNLKFFYHKPLAFMENLPGGGVRKPGCEDDIFSTHVYRRSQDLASDLSMEMVGQELFDVGCPVELKFDNRSINLGLKELELYQNLKKQDLYFQRSFKQYQDYISREKC